VSARRWLLLAFAGFAAVHVVGVLFHSPLLPSSGMLAWTALGAYAVLAGRNAPRAVQLALTTGLLTLGVMAGVDLWARSETTTGAQFLFYGQAPQRDLFAALESGLQEIAPFLLGYGCLTVAVFALARARRRSRTGRIVAVTGVTCAIGYAALQLWSRADGPREWLLYSVALLAPVAVAIAAFLAAGPAAGSPTGGAAGTAVAPVGRRVVSVGMVLIGLAAMSLFDDVLSRMWSWPLEDFSMDADQAIAISVAVSATGSDWGMAGDQAITAALQVAGAAAVTVGCLSHLSPQRQSENP
jgi:hypothetical protein